MNAPGKSSLSYYIQLYVVCQPPIAHQGLRFGYLGASQDVTRPTYPDGENGQVISFGATALVVSFGPPATVFGLMKHQVLVRDGRSPRQGQVGEPAVGGRSWGWVNSSVSCSYRPGYAPSHPTERWHVCGTYPGRCRTRCTCSWRSCVSRPSPR